MRRLLLSTVSLFACNPTTSPVDVVDGVGNDVSHEVDHAGNTAEGAADDVGNTASDAVDSVAGPSGSPPPKPDDAADEADPDDAPPEPEPEG